MAQEEWRTKESSSTRIGEETHSERKQISESTEKEHRQMEQGGEKEQIRESRLWQRMLHGINEEELQTASNE